jgi:hypothetical protein
VSAPRPRWDAVDPDPAPADLAVRWDALPPGWEGVDWRLTLPGEDRRGHANLVRARVAEGLIDPANLSFADWLEGREA